MEAKFEYFFYDTHRKANYYEYHQHPCCELVYYLSGQGLSNIDGVAFPFRKGTFSFMPVNCLHNRSYSEDTEFLAIGFLFNLPLELKGGVYQDDNGKILSFLQEVKEEFINRKNHFQLRLNTLIIEIMIEMDRLINKTKKPDDFNAFTYIRNYLDVHYHEKVNFGNLAEISFYSYDHFRHKFKEFTGYSPHQYLMFRRMESAKEKLIRTDAGVGEIAMECGFSTSAQFCYLFKKYVSQTPVEFRKRHQRELRDER
jgi:AraC-like DNA-binding protein